jgi:sugar-phosphatase
VIEDTPAGIQAGRAAGAMVLAVATTFSTADLGGADVVIDSLTLIAAVSDKGIMRLTIGD